MSVATRSSQSPVAPSPSNQAQDSGPNISSTERVILDYLHVRGYTAALAEKALLEEIEAASPLAANIQNLIASIGSIRAEEILSLDSTDKQEGFRELEAWVAVAVTLYRVSSPTSYFCDTTLNVL